MKNDYYNEIVTEIKELIEQKRYKEALFLIETEKNVPYVPTDFEEKLSHLEKQIIPNIEASFQHKVLDPEELEAMLFSKNTELIVSALYGLKNLNASNYLMVFKKFFIEKSIKNDYKTLLLLQLNKQNIDKEFKIVKDGNEIIINAKELKLTDFERLFKEVRFIYNKVFDEKNVTEYKFFSDLLMEFIDNYIPFPIPYEAWEVAIAIMENVKKLFSENFDRNYYIAEYELDGAKIESALKVLENIGHGREKGE